MAAAAARKIKPEPDPHVDPLIGGMTFLEHLEEFRKRMIRSIVALVAGAAVAFVFIDRIFNFVFEPTRRSLPAGSRLIFTQPGEPFALYINIALMAGAVIAAPAICYQIWRFIAPGLYAREKRFAIPFVLLTTCGTVAGAGFNHYIVFPYMIGFFGTFSNPDLLFMPRVEDIFDLYLKMLAGMIVIFQMPTFAFFLAKLRIVTAGWLWRNLRYAILIIFVAAAVLTPSADPWNQLIFATPMLALYVLSIGIAWAVAPRS
jgi:sec-independent protein translocase protein TatC